MLLGLCVTEFLHGQATLKEVQCVLKVLHSLMDSLITGPFTFRQGFSQTGQDLRRVEEDVCAILLDIQRVSVGLERDMKNFEYGGWKLRG